MLFIAPAPADFSGSTIRNAPKPIITFTSIIYFIQLLNKTPRRYTYSDEAALLITEQFDKYLKYARFANMFDFFFA